MYAPVYYRDCPHILNQLYIVSLSKYFDNNSVLIHIISLLFFTMYDKEKANGLIAGIQIETPLRDSGSKQTIEIASGSPYKTLHISTIHKYTGRNLEEWILLTACK